MAPQKNTMTISNIKTNIKHKEMARSFENARKERNVNKKNI